MPRMRLVKKNDGEDEFNYIWYIVRTFVNATMYPSRSIKKEICTGVAQVGRVFD
jgi:hypothetical protein